MAQYLKINSQVLNADTIITPIVRNGNEVWVITTETKFSLVTEKQFLYFKITTGGAAEAQALLIAINKALTANPGGRVVEVAPSSDYTISSIVYETDE